jgi:hypothetical protein
MRHVVAIYNGHCGLSDTVSAGSEEGVLTFRGVRCKGGEQKAEIQNPGPRGSGQPAGKHSAVNSLRAAKY